MIAIVSDTSEAFPGTTFYIEDYAAATENILLAATALGYACGWIDHLLRAPAINRPLRTLLRIPADRELMVLIPVGKRRSQQAAGEKPFAQRCSWNYYAIERQAAEAE